jgi:BRCT domain type II-containing protein
MVFNGQQFVLFGTWPGLGGGQDLSLGKDNVKTIIKRHGGNVTSGFLRLTNVLVIGDNPGKKKVLDAHECGLPIVELNQLTSMIINKDKTILDLHSAPYPEAMTAILTQHNIQVKHPPPTSDLTEQCRVAGNSTNKDVPGKDEGMGVSHSIG